MSNKRETIGEAARRPTRVKTLLMVGVLGALITVVSGATLEAMQQPQTSQAVAQMGSGGVAAAADTSSGPLGVAPETLYLLLLGAVLFCVAAGVSAVSSPNASTASSTR